MQSRAERTTRVRKLALTIGSSRCILHPDSTVSAGWDMLIAMMVAPMLVTIPLSMGFRDVNDRLFFANLVMEGFFVADIAKNFFTGRHTASGTIVMSHGRIAKHYLKSWFLPDLLSAIPVDSILVWSNIEADANADNFALYNKSLKLMRLLRMAKLLRLMRFTQMRLISRLVRTITYLRRFMEDTMNVHIPQPMIYMLMLLCVLLLAAHWLGCVNFMLVRLWNFPTSSWVTQAGLADQHNVTEARQYSYALYKALYQMVDGENILRSGYQMSCDSLDDSSEGQYCQVETWVTLCSLWIGNIFYALIIGVFSSVVSRQDQSRRAFENKVSQVNAYMRVRSLPADLRFNIREYYQIRFSHGRMFDEDEILKDLSPGLRDQVLQWNVKHLVEVVPFLSHCDALFISRVSLVLRPEVELEGKVIFEERSAGSKMYFISSGLVEILCHSGGLTHHDRSVSKYSSFDFLQSGAGHRRRGAVAHDLQSGAGHRRRGAVAHDHSNPPHERQGQGSAQGSQQVLPTLPFGAPVDGLGVVATVISDGCYFGEIALLFKKSDGSAYYRRTASARVSNSHGTCIMYSLERADIMPLLQEYPTVREGLTVVAQGRLARMQLLRSQWGGGGMVVGTDREDIKTELFCEEPIDEVEKLDADASMMGNSRRRRESIVSASSSRSAGASIWGKVQGARRGLLASLPSWREKGRPSGERQAQT